MELLKRALASLLVAGAAVIVPCTWAQQENRIAKTKVEPVYPELARRMGIRGVVKVQITIAPNGTVKDEKLVGGHPLLANAVLDAVKKWRYEARPQETTVNLEFRFNPDE